MSILIIDDLLQDYLVPYKNIYSIKHLKHMLSLLNKHKVNGREGLIESDLRLN